MQEEWDGKKKGGEGVRTGWIEKEREREGGKG